MNEWIEISEPDCSWSADPTVEMKTTCFNFPPSPNQIPPPVRGFHRPAEGGGGVWSICLCGNSEDVFICAFWPRGRRKEGRKDVGEFGEELVGT